jgi:hypothetical protein
MDGCPPPSQQPPDGAAHHRLDVPEPVLDVLPRRQRLLQGDVLAHAADHVDELAVLIDVDVVDPCGPPTATSDTAYGSCHSGH